VNLSPLVVRHGADDIGYAVQNLRRPNVLFAAGERHHFLATHAVDDATESGRRHPAGTHRARFGAGVHHGLRAFVRAVLPTRPVREVEFRVAPDVRFRVDAVRVAHDDGVVADEDGAERFVAAGGGLAGEVECRTHMRRVIEAVEIGGSHDPSNRPKRDQSFGTGASLTTSHRTMSHMRGFDQIDTVGVVGAGTMGSGIAQVAATAGYDVVMRDIEDDLVADGFDRIDDSLSRFVEKEQLSRAEADAAVSRITGTTDLSDLGECDYVIEAAVENMDIKRDIFADLDEAVDDDVILATNTSTLSITTIASATERPELVVGLHFMNPAPIMEGLELVVGERTSDDAVDCSHTLAEDFGKTTWESDDKPGFVVNRVLMPWINEGIRAYDEGVAGKADMDAGLKLGTNVPMGPLELADHIGLDVCLDASQTLADELGDRYKPPYLLKRKVDAGDLGRKTGRGFYEYD